MHYFIVFSVNNIENNTFNCIFYCFLLFSVCVLQYYEEFPMEKLWYFIKTYHNRKTGGAALLSGGDQLIQAFVAIIQICPQ